MFMIIVIGTSGLISPKKFIAALKISGFQLGFEHHPHFACDQFPSHDNSTSKQLENAGESELLTKRSKTTREEIVC